MTNIKGLLHIYCNKKGYFFVLAGTEEERGLLKWRANEIGSHDSSESHENETFDETSSLQGENVSPRTSKVTVSSPYDIPFITKSLRKEKWAKYVPFFPTFNGYPRIYGRRRLSCKK